MVLPKNPKDLRTMLFDDAIPLPHRVRVFTHFLNEQEEIGAATLASILENGRTPEVEESIHAKKVKELTELIEQMGSGPLRTAVYVRMVAGARGPGRAHVILDDGSSAFVVVPDPELGHTLRKGDVVMLEAEGKAVLFRDETLVTVGEQARFERRVDDHRIEVTIRESESRVVHVADVLGERIREGAVEPGRSLLVCSRRSFAFDAIPETDGLSHFRYLSRQPVPDVRLGRDLASPPSYIGRFLEATRIQLENPELAAAFGLRSCHMALLAGVSGSGKTYSLQALERALYELMAEHTSVPIPDLPPRVFRMRMSEMLSKWLGEAEKNLDRFFDEVEELASQPFTAPDGTTHLLPVLVVIEEIDGLGRARGQGEPILDRILTTVLRRLDTSRPDLQTRRILFVGTTNVAGQVDPAFLRRIGGTVETFGRLARADFAAVLRTHLRGRPLSTEGIPEGSAHASAHASALDDVLAGVTGWAFGERDSDPGLVELQFAGAATTERRFRRDLFTASLVDRAVQDAAWAACRVSDTGGSHGITIQQLITALDAQIRAVVDQLQPGNVGEYMDLPDGVRVATVRRVERPVLSPHQLERVA